MNEKILIIDDDVDTLKLVGLMLQKQSYQIVAANNGLQGLEQAENENPDLILLDVMMPGMDGYEVAKRLRQSAHSQYPHPDVHCQNTVGRQSHGVRGRRTIT